MNKFAAFRKNKVIAGYFKIESSKNRFEKKYNKCVIL